MSIPWNIDSWKMPDKLIGYYSKTKGNANDDSLTVFVPIITPLLSMSAEKTSTDKLVKSCFINDKKCLPTISSSISLQNYTTIPRIQNQLFGNSIKDIAFTRDSYGNIIEGKTSIGTTYLSQGDTVSIIAKNCNVDDMYITNEIDNSTK